MKPQGRIDKIHKFDPILADPNNWPVRKLSKNRKQFIHEVIEDTVQKIKHSTASLREELETTIYREKLRTQQSPWKVDPEDEGSFWGEVRARLLAISHEPEHFTQKVEEEILRDIVSRYVNEIAGTFKPSYYKMTRRLVTFGFNRLLNASRVEGFGSFWSNQYSLQDKIHVTGELEHIRKLAKIGTVVVVPTHYSNLDSVLVGWVIDLLGIPPVAYGAGLNLFNIGIFAYFMNSLGAYKVDRRKKNLVYLESLKSYSSLSIEKGCHSLFFPGGTRSRSGKIEKKLKLGLLGTAMEAQRRLYEQAGENGKAQKIFIVPVALNYHFVLEAPDLIHEYLAKKGQERYYVETDQYSNSYKILKFLVKFFTKGSDISVSFGRGMDMLGNYVNDEGHSLDKHGNRIHTRDYFVFNGKVTPNKQREDEYTRMLSERIVEEFHRISRVFSSHLVAFTAFRMIVKRYPKMDLYDVLRLPEEDRLIDYSEFRETYSRLREQVIRLHEQGKVDVAPHLYGEVDDVIEHGLANVGIFHAKRPLIKNREGKITTEDISTLFYYHNRLIGYDLEKYV
jgi:glycerol-3-phosphate O-acyltransferase